MDLLTSSGSSVPAAAAGKAVGTWATRRPFGGVDNGRFCMFWGTVASGNQIRRCRCRECAPMCVVVEGTRGGRERRERGRRKINQTHRQIRVTGLTQKKYVRQLKLNNTMKMYGMIVMIRYHQTNSGALNTMVALKLNGNGEIDILVTILVCWRLGPYADPDQQGDQ
jgi:hypothetical protein